MTKVQKGDYYSDIGIFNYLPVKLKELSKGKVKLSLYRPWRPLGL
jgi:hypothetical protein